MASFDFDTVIDRRQTHSDKWDMMQAKYGVSADTGLAMWVADMDFRPPAKVLDQLQEMQSHGVLGYYGDDSSYRQAICSWMSRRHSWQVEPDWIHTTHGLGNGIALCLQAFTEPGEGVMILTPVYHAFERIIKAAGRQAVSVDLALEEGLFQLDFASMEAALTGNERMLLFCSPHNPGGRVWTKSELQAVAQFCQRHNLICVCDEIHHDIVLPQHQHIAMPVAAPDLTSQLVMLSATTKSFNLAGGLTGNVIIADPELRRRFRAVQAALAIEGNAFGKQMAEAAYNHGDEWMDALCQYLAENAQLFKEGLEQIPGVSVMELQATYLCWVDFSALGMEMDEVIHRVQSDAEIAASHGITFGKAGAHYLRFNIAMARSQITESIRRLQTAFADIQ